MCTRDRQRQREEEVARITQLSERVAAAEARGGGSCGLSDLARERMDAAGAAVKDAPPRRQRTAKGGLS
eukprot:5277271-Prymnesium_polylepis.1